jgi:hypothetical protein
MSPALSSAPSSSSRIRRALNAAGPAPAARDRLARLDEELATLRRLAERGRAREAGVLIADLGRERAELAAPAPGASRGRSTCSAIGGCGSCPTRNGASASRGSSSRR